MKNKDIFISDNSIAIELIKKYTYPYEVLPNIHDYILELGDRLDTNYVRKGTNIWIHNTAIVDDDVKIIGPCIVDAFATLRHSAYIRGNVIIGKNSTIGNSCEIKNSIIFDNCSVPHFNYVGDSILGDHVHISAGVITSNVKIDKKLVTIKYNDEVIETDLRKVGAFIGDNVEIGCNTVLNPGTIIKYNTIVYPLLSIRGVIESNMIVKSMDNIVRRDSNE